MVEAKVPAKLMPTIAIVGSGTENSTKQRRQLCALVKEPHSMPRQIRVRVAQVPVGTRKKRSPDSPKTPPSPNQDVSYSPFSKKAALGPWNGPFETHAATEAALPSTLYLDECGVTYVSLTGVSEPTIKLPLADLDANTLAAQKLMAEASKGAMMLPKEWRQRARVTSQRQSAKPWQCGRMHSSYLRNHAINQPRKS